METSAECTALVREANQGPRFVKFQWEKKKEPEEDTVEVVIGG